MTDEDEGPEPTFLNSYCCPNCDHDWQDEYPCQVDDECPNCGTRHIGPYWSDDVDGCVEASKDALDSAREDQRDKALTILRAERRIEKLETALRGLLACPDLNLGNLEAESQQAIDDAQRLLDAQSSTPA